MMATLTATELARIDAFVNSMMDADRDRRRRQVQKQRDLAALIKSEVRRQLRAALRK